MNRRQLITVIITVLVFIGALVVAAYFGDDGMRERGGGFKFKQGPRQAKTTVNESLYEKLAGPDIAKVRSDSPPAAESGGAVRSQNRRASPEEAAATDALNALTPELGISRIEKLLATLDNLENAASLYTALGALHGQTGIEGQILADEAFATAKRLARSQQERHRAALGHVTALAARGDTDAAADVAADALDGDQPLTLPGLQLAVVYGRLREQRGENEQAEAAFETAMENALAAQPVLQDDALDVYRQACLSLVQLYRKTGREQEAESLIFAMKQTVARPSRR